MRSYPLVRAALGLRWGPPQLPPTFLQRSQLHQTAQSTQFQDAPPDLPPQSSPLPQEPSAVSSASASFQPLQSPHLPPTTPSPSPPAIQPKEPLVLSKSLQQLLPNLSTQKPHYITAHIHRFPYLLTEGDTVRLPFHMHGVSPGDVLRLNRASLLGSRDYTLKAGTHSTATYDGVRTGEPNHIDERLFECRARVLGVDSGPMKVKIKTKRRQRKKKHVYSKHRYTVLRVMQVKVRSVEELMKSGEENELILQ